MTSVYPADGRSEWIAAQRPHRAALDPLTPNGFFLEEELDAAGRRIPSAVIFLTNKECPWRCLMCDLWKTALPQSVPSGVIPGQIDYALQRLNTRPLQIKLYNSGSFFDAAAVPVTDYPAIAEQVAFVERVIVECHPRLATARAVQFRDLLAKAGHANGSSLPHADRVPYPALHKQGLSSLQLGPQLEIALGLETIHPEVLPRLNKRFDLGHFAKAADFLARSGIALRTFLLIKPPFIDEDQAGEWAMKSAEFAFSCGSTVVSLIPTRAGNGAIDRLIQAGEFSLPRLSTIEQAFEQTLRAARAFSSRRVANSGNSSPQGRPAGCIGPRVFLDLWNLEQFSNCHHCFESRRARLAEINLTQQLSDSISCPDCGGM